MVFLNFSSFTYIMLSFLLQSGKLQNYSLRESLIKSDYYYLQKDSVSNKKQIKYSQLL